MSHTFVFYNTSDCMDSGAIETAFGLASTSAQMDGIYQIPTELLMLPQYCQPYLDHSYAKIPTSSSNSVDLQQLPVSIDTSTDQLGAFIDIEDISCNTTVVTAPTERGGANDEPSEGADPWEGSVTRCVCDFQHDDGYMICCDRCGVWQHVDCMGVDRNNIPESYLCELCLPRLVDKRRAIRLQTLKKEQMDMSDMSASDSSSDEIFGRRGSGRKKPGRKRMDGRPNAAQRRPVKRKTSEPDEERLADKRNRPAATSGKVTGLRGPRRQSAGESSLRARRNSVFEADQHVTIDHSVEDICQNSYTVGVRSLLAATKDNETATVKLNATTPTNPSLLKEQISKQRIRLVEFGPNVKGVAANETIRINQAVAEYTGRVMMVEEFDRSNRSESAAVPFVLRYAGPQGMNICIDASVSGNDVKYIRCSCMPNAKVVHIVERNALRFFICATKNIAEGREVTIPFYFDYQKSDLEVFCACGRASCQVARFFKQKSSSRPIRVRRSAALPDLEDKPRLAATNVLDNGKAGATPSSTRQNNRRSALASDISKIVNPDVGTDITLMNALAAISTAAFNGAPMSSPQLTICSADTQFNGGHSLDASGGAGHKHGEEHGEASSVTKMKEATKGEKGKKQPGSGGRNKGQHTPGTKPEMETDRIGLIRSNRLRDKAQQLAAISGQKE